MMNSPLFLWILTLVIFPLGVFATVIHVPADQPSIQEGIDAASDGDTVLVADGTYSGPGNCEIDFKGKVVTLISENGPQSCIISCMDTDVAFYFHSNESESSKVEGFTVTGGKLHCENSSPCITNCTITKTISLHAGGGLYCYTASPLLNRCVFSENSTMELASSDGGFGGGVYCNHFSSPLLNDCLIMENQCEFYGGGVYCYDHSSPSLTNCIVFKNSAGDSGGGLYCYNNASPVLMNCIVYENVSYGEYIVAIYNSYKSQPEIINSIVYHNEGVQIFHNSDISVKFSTVQSGFPGIGNLDSDPLFYGGDPFDFHLSSSSPCIDAGTDDGLPETDYDSRPRLQGGAVDMGAHEFDGWPSTPRSYITMPSHTIRPGDTVACKATVWNPNSYSLDNQNLFVILEAFGQIYMAPDFSAFDSYYQSFEPGVTDMMVIPEFGWPSGAGTASGILWFAGLVNSGMTSLTSEIGVYEFSWSE